MELQDQLREIKSLIEQWEQAQEPARGGVSSEIASAQPIVDQLLILADHLRSNQSGVPASSLATLNIRCLSRLGDLLPDAVMVVDLQGHVKYINKAVSPFCDKTPSDLIGISIEHLPFVTSPDSDRLMLAIKTALAERTPTEPFIAEVKGSSGRRNYVQVHIDSLQPEGRIEGVVVVLRAVSDTIKAEKELTESRRRLQTLMDNLPGMAYRCLNDPDWTMEIISQGAFPLTGYESHELVNNSVVSYAELIHPEDRALVWEVVQTGIEHRRPFQMQYRIITKSGQEKWVWEQGRGVWDESGHLTALEGFITNISDRKHAEEALRRSEENYRQLVEDLNDVIYELNLSGEVVYISPVIEELAGYKVKDIIGTKFSDFVYVDDLDRVRVGFDNVLQGKRQPNEYRFISKDGQVFWIRTFTRRFYREGRLAGLRGVLTDITDRKLAEIAVSESRQLLSETLAGSPAAAFVIDRDHVITHWNRACEALTGLQATEMVGTRKHWMPFYPQERKIFADLIVDGMSDARLKEYYADKFRPSNHTPGAYEAEDFFPKLDGGKGRWIFFTAAPVHDTSGRLVGAIETLQDVTERRRAEIALKENEENLSSLIRVAPVGIGLVINRVLQRVNDLMCELTGYDADELVGMDARVLYPSVEEYERVGREKYGEIARRGTGSIETQWRRKNGEVIDVLLSSTPLDVKNLDRGVTFTALDITHSKQAQAALRVSEERYRRIVETASEGIWMVNADYVTTFVNQKMADILGYNIEDMIGVHALDFMYQDELQDQKAEMIARRQGKPGQYERRFRRRDGSICWILVSASPVVNQKDEFVGSLAMLTDITERKRAEQAVQESEKRYRALFESATDAILLINGNRVVDCNPATEALFSRKRDQIIGMTLDRFAPDSQPNGESSAITALRRIREAAAGAPQSFEWQVNREDGTTFDVEVSLSRVDLADRLFLLAFLRDITRRKQVEAQLRASEERFRAVFEAAQDLIYIKDTTFRYVAVNPVTAAVFGRAAEEIEGAADTDIHPPDVVERLREADRRVLAGDIHKEITEYTVNGKSMIFDVVKVPMRGADGSVVGVCGIARDITEKRRIEDELARADKLESIGLLAGGIAHDFNNILAAILGNISLAKMDVEETSEAYDLLANAEKATERARDLTQQLLTFAKGGMPVKQTASITDILTDCASFSLRGSNVKASFDLPDDLWGAELDVGQISQVVHNLIINADQAMPSGGELLIRAANVLVGPDHNIPLSPGKYVRISVRDQGPGIAEEHLSKIFDPFFTTKKRGSGLGLATTFSIVKKHDGHIMCDSQPGMGAEFTLYLPATDKKIARARKHEGGAPVTRRGHILIMDDEKEVRDILIRILSKAGYRVDAVHDGDEAIVRYRHAANTGDPFDVLIMDLTIPGGRGGKETIEHLKRIDPMVRAIVASGYSNDPVMADFRTWGFLGRVTKPFNTDDLLAVLDDVVPLSVRE